MMVDYGPGPITHYEDCWRTRSHWRCAVARVEALEDELEDYRKRWGEEAKEKRNAQICAANSERSLKQCREKLAALEQAWTEGRKRVAARLARHALVIAGELSDDENANFTQTLKASADVVKQLECELDTMLEQARAEERRRCLGVVDYWREFASIGLEKVKPFAKYDSESKTKANRYRGAIHVLMAVENDMREADDCTG